MSNTELYQLDQDGLVISKQNNYLHWSQRPNKTIERINRVFEHISKRNDSGWRFNGQLKYNHCDTDEYKLINYMIQQSPNQSKFTVLDVGAGKGFLWINNFISFFEKEHPDKQITAIGINGEGCISRIKQYNNTIIKELCSFKTEDIIDQFSKLQIYASDNVDLIVSRSTLFHLVDPFGTFQQLLTLLKPSTGFLLTDSFVFDYRDNAGNEIYQTRDKNIGTRMFDLLSNADVKFLICPDFKLSWLSHLKQIAIQKPNNGHVTFPLSYDEENPFGGFNYYDYTSNYETIRHIPVMTRFISTDDNTSAITSVFPLNDEAHRRYYFGDQEIYDTLAEVGFMNNCESYLTSYNYTRHYCEGGCIPEDNMYDACLSHLYSKYL